MRSTDPNACSYSDLAGGGGVMRYYVDDPSAYQTRPAPTVAEPSTDDDGHEDTSPRLPSAEERRDREIAVLRADVADLRCRLARLESQTQP